MPFCKSCGSPVEGRFCAKCGAPQDAPSAPNSPPPGQPYSQPGGQAPQPPPAAAGGMADNVAGALCYVLGLITGILFLALAPYNQNKFVRFHAFQSIFFNVAWIALWIVEAVITAILPWGLHLIVSLLYLVVALGGFVIWILLLVKAYQGQQWELPFIGGLAKQQA